MVSRAELPLVIRVMKLDNTVLRFSISKTTTMADFKLLLEQHRVLGAYDSKAIVVAAGMREPDASVALVSVLPANLEKGRSAHIILTKEFYYAGYAVALADRLDDEALSLRSTQKLEFTKGTLLALKNTDSSIVFACKLDSKCGEVNASYLSMITCTSAFVRRIRERRDLLTLTSSIDLQGLPFDVIRTIFSLLQHPDFLAFRLSCIHVFLASTNVSVQSRINYLCKLRWSRARSTDTFRL